MFGAGPIDLVWMPHWATHVEMMWEDPLHAAFLSGLGAFSRVIVFDKRGVGLSDPVGLAAHPIVESWADDLGAVLDAAGVDRAAVTASDFAGYIAILFAAAHPERAQALVLVNTTARVTRAADYPIGVPDRVVEEALADVERGWGTAWDMELMDPSLAGNERMRTQLGRYQRATASPGTMASMARMLVETDVRAVLPAVRVPTLVVHRSGDRYLRASHGRYLAEHIPGARYVELAGADHTPFVSDADAVLAELQAFLTGDWPMVGPDRVLKAVLFTDIVGSTAAASDLMDRRWRETLDAYDRFALRQLNRFGGHYVKSTGDGTLATFDGPRRAIACAVALRDGVRALGLEIRAGVHTGEVEVRGDDLTGIAVHLAQRVCAAAGPGAVVVTRTVVDLVAGTGIPLDDLGAHALKG